MVDVEEYFSENDSAVVVSGFTTRLRDGSTNENPFDFDDELHGVWIEAYFTAHALMKAGVLTFVELTA